MDSFNKLKNNYNLVVNNLKLGLDFNKYLKNTHIISERDFVNYYKKWDDIEIVREFCEESVLVENLDLKNYENWIVNGN